MEKEYKVTVLGRSRHTFLIGLTDTELETVLQFLEIMNKNIGYDGLSVEFTRYKREETW